MRDTGTYNEGSFKALSLKGSLKSCGTVTIIIPTYRRAERLRRAIQSVLLQTYTDIVVLVCDNASCDGTAEVVEEMAAVDSRIIYHCHSENIGMVANFNFGFGRVATPYFGILTDDDYFLPSFISDAMDGFCAHQQIQLAVLSIPAILEDGTAIADQLDKWPREGFYRAGESRLLAVEGNHPVITGCIFRREIISDVVLDSNMGCGIDVAVMIKLLAKHSFFLSKKVGGYFVRHAEAAGNDSERAVPDTFSFISRIEGYIQAEEAIVPEVKKLLLDGLRRKVDAESFSLLLLTLKTGDKRWFKTISDSFIGRRRSRYYLGAHALQLLAAVPGGGQLVTLVVNTIKGLRNAARKFGT